MAEENLVTNIVAKSNFSDLIADLNRVSSKLLGLQQSLNTTNKTLAVQAAQIQKSFSETMRSTGQFSTHFVSLQSDVDKFGRSLDSGRMKLGQYYGAWKEHSRTAGGLIRDLARQQVQLQNSVLQPMGKNAQGIMQYAVHVPRGLDEIKNKTAIARQEMLIMNKVIQDGANQVINWGKNTQWAGRQLTVGLTIPITLFGKAAADAFRQADEQLVRLTKVYGGVAATSAQDLAKVRKEVSQTARELAAAYGASYKDTIGLAADIAATGKQGEELLKSTREATRLSILGEVDRQDAMKATLSIQTAFKQNTTELAESINFLNAVENQTSTSLADLVEAIPKAGPVVKALGGNVQDLALYLTAMREGGINASEGANALKSALASIINPTKVAKEMFTGFGIDLGGIVTKNAGNLTATILEIQKALDSLDPLNKAQAIEQLFGKFQFARMNALFENLGKQGSQTLQVLDLMKASSTDLANIAGRELAQITESASGKYRRALETLKADLAGIGEQFLNFGTKIINIIDGVIRFFNKLPDPVKKILTFVTGLTALTGPIIMLTGLFANFFGYIAKGLFHLRALVKGGQGFKLLTPEIIAAEQAGQLMETQFYDDAKAAAVLQKAVANLTAELSVLTTKANAARLAVGPAITTAAGSVIVEGQSRVADPTHPLIGPAYSRSFAHLNPVAGMTEAERLSQTIFGVAPNPTPLNQKISNNPQMYMSGDLPKIDRVSSAKGFSTGIVAGEAAKWHAMTAALAMQSKEEIALLKTEVAATGTVTSSLSSSYQALLPEMTRITSLAAQEGALIVRQLEAGKLTVDQARARIIALNAQIETMMAQTAAGVAAAQGRTVALTTVPLTSQPVVDPRTGKSNMKELFHKGPTAALVDQIARSLGVRTSGGGYSIETTKPRRFNVGGRVYDPSRDGNVVPGDTSINYDNTPAILREGGFVLNQGASKNNPDLVSMAQNANNAGGKIVPALLTPGETYFPPEMAESMMPMLEKANSGSRIILRNVGGLLGGRVISNRFNYGLRPGFMTYAQMQAALKAIVGGRTGSRTILNYMQRPQLTSGVLKATPQTIDEMLGIPLGKGMSYNEFGHIVKANGEISVVGKVAKPATVLFGEKSESINEALARKGLTGQQYNDFLKLLLRHGNGSITGSTSQLFASIPKGIATKKLLKQIEKEITSRYLRELFRMKRAGIPLRDENNPYHDISSQVIRELAPQNKHLQSIWKQWSTSTSAVNPHYLSEIRKGRGAATTGAKDIVMTNPKTGETFTVPALKGSGGTFAYHAANKDWEARYGYDITRNWPKKQQFYPMGYQYDVLNRDPLHGPLIIGNAARVSGDTAGSVSKSAVFTNQFGKMEFADVGASGGSEVAQAMYLARRYMAGDPRIMGQMEYETKNRLNAHPLSIQSKLKAISKKFTGQLFRGVPGRRLDSTFPPDIVKEIEIARATGDASGLIGKEFIMRRASFSSDPTVAKYFTGFNKDAIFIEASLKNRNVTPIGELFPDAKFTAPYGQKWGTAISGNKLSEKESLVGGKFRIKDFKDGKIVIETSGIEPREKGGNVNAGQPYLVGEKGPELFVPKNNGGIVSNYELGGLVRGGKLNYGVSGNPAKRAQEEAARAARAAAHAASPGVQPEYKPGPLTGSKTTVIGSGGVRTNVYGVQGSLPYAPGLTLMHPAMNMLEASVQRTIIGIKMMGDSTATAYATAGAKMTMAQQQLVGSVTTMGEAIKSSAISMANGIKSTATSVATGIKTAAATTMSALSSFRNMANPGYAAGFGKNLAYGTSLMLNPFGRRSGAAPGSRMANFGAGQMGGMAGMMAGSMAGMFLGQKVGGQTGSIVGSIVGSMAYSGITGLVRKIGEARVAGLALGTALKTVLGVVGRFIPIVGTLTTIGMLLWKWKRNSEDVGKANRAVFGPTEKSLKEVGLKYKSLNDRLKEYRTQVELSRAAGLASLTKDGKTSISALTLTVKELDKGIEDAKKNAKESVQIFNKTDGKQDVIRLAASLKQQYVSAGMGIQEATNKIYTLIKASDKGAYALEAISSKAFKSITDQASAADYALGLVTKTLNSGEFNVEEITVGIQNVINSLDAYRASIVGTKIDGNVVSEAEALRLTIEKINNLKGAQVDLDKETVAELKKQNLELNYVLRANETLAGVYAKSALLQSSVSDDLDLMGMTSQEAVTVAKGVSAYNQEVEKTIEADLKLGSIASKLKQTYNSAVKAAQGFTSVSYDKIIKQQEEIIKQVDKELRLRLKNLEAQEKAADFATNLKKEQLNYQRALMSGDMTAAAQAQLNIDQLQKENEIMLAKQALEDAAEKKREAAQKKIDAANAQKELLQEKASAAQTAATTASTSATAFLTFQSTLNRLVSSISPNEKLDETDKEVLRTGLKDALDLLKQSGKQGADFVKSFMGKNMAGGGVPYLQAQAASAYSDASTGKFATAVDKFAAAVDEMNVGKPFKPAEKSEVRETNELGPFNSKKVAMKFEHPNNQEIVYGVVSHESDAEAVHAKWRASGYIFRGYDKTYAKTGVLGEKLKFSTQYGPPPKLAMGGAVESYASGGSYAPGIGGYIKGPGTPTSDSILLSTGNGGLIRASDTEFMQPASAVSYYGTDFMEDIRARRIPREMISAAMGGAIPGYHVGGKVGHKHGGMPQLSMPVGSTATVDFNAKPTTASKVSDFIFGELTGLGSFFRIVNKKASPFDYIAMLPLLGVGAKTLNAVGRSAVEMMGISKGIPGLGSLLPKGSIPYAAAMSSKAANTALAATLAGSKVATSGLSSPSLTPNRIGLEDTGLAGFGGPDIRQGRRMVGTENWGSLITSDSDIRQILAALSAHYGVDVRPTVVRESMEGSTAGYYSGMRESMHFPDKTRGNVVAHEITHAADYQGAYWSFKDMLEYMIKTDPAAAKIVFNQPMLNAYNTAMRGGNKTPWLYEALEKAINDYAPQHLPYWNGLLEKNAISKIPNIMPGGLDLGNPYSAIYGGRLANMLNSSLEKGYAHYRSPKFWEAVISDENMPKHLIAKGRSWIAALGRYGVTENTPADDFGLTKLIEYAKETGLAMGGMIPKFHNGGQVNTKFAGGETMALLKDKEVVFTQEQMAALGSMGSSQNSMVPTSITYAPVINAAPGMDEETLANLVMVKLGTATNIRYKANGSSGMRVIK